ncbi:MAG: DUF3875 domain-containing protein [Ginsengibacter sp.]
MKSLFDILPLYGVQHDAILSKMGDVSVGFKLQLPELFTLSNDDYEAFHHAWIKAIKILPAYTVLHKQDWFTEAKYKANFSYKISTDVNEQRIYKKIDELNRQINQPETTYNNLSNQNQPNDNNEGFSNDVDKLHNMMQVMNDKEEADPEMQQLNGTLDKILDIQHPQRVKDKLKEKSLQQKEVVFAVSKIPVADNISLLDTSKHKAESNAGFYGIDDNESQSEEDNAIEELQCRKMN